ncbi:hypothetical protein Aperf_G00000065223 [Anoplocephala perfoliata]
MSFLHSGVEFNAESIATVELILPRKSKQTWGHARRRVTESLRCNGLNVSLNVSQFPDCLHTGSAAITFHTCKCDSKKVKSEEYQATSSTEEVVRLEAENETIVDEGGWLLEQAMQAAIMNPEENTVVHINTAAESDATRINRDAIDEGGLLLEEAMQAARIEPREEGTVLSSTAGEDLFATTAEPNKYDN